MILRDEIFFNAIKEYVDYNRENKLKFNMFIQVQPGSELARLPEEAYNNGLLHISFDFGGEETWVADQIVMEDGCFKCVLVYQGTEGWNEYPIEFPVINIVGISRNNFIQSQFQKIHIEYDNDFLDNVQNSKKHLKLIRE